MALDLDQIRRAISERAIRQVDLADALGILPNKVSLSLAGKRQFKAREWEILRGILADDDQDAGPIRAIPVIGLVAAGNWREATQHSRDSIPSPDPSIPPKAIAFEVTGDSMDLLVEEGGRVIVDPDDKSLYPDRYYVITNADGEATFKQFKVDPARLVPCSTNPEHREIQIGAELFDVVGRVIWRAARM